MAILTRAMTSADHAEALRTILKVTRRAWMLADSAKHESIGSTESKARHEGDACPAATVDGQPQSGEPQGPTAPCRRRRCQLADNAARAFEAEVMALRCRQAFVA